MIYEKYKKRLVKLFFIFLFLLLFNNLTAQHDKYYNLHGNGFFITNDHEQVNGELLYNYKTQSVFFKENKKVYVLSPSKILYVRIYSKLIGVMNLVPLNLPDGDFKLKLNKFEYHDILMAGNITISRVIHNHHLNYDLYTKQAKNIQYNFLIYLFDNEKFTIIPSNWKFKKHVLPLMKDKKSEIKKVVKSKRILRKNKHNRLIQLVKIVYEYNCLKDSTFVKTNPIEKLTK